MPFLCDSFIHYSTPVLSRRTQHPARRRKQRRPTSSGLRVWFRPENGSQLTQSAWAARTLIEAALKLAPFPSCRL